MEIVVPKTQQNPTLDIHYHPSELKSSCKAVSINRW